MARKRPALTRTNHSLTDVDDESKRRRTLTQLNRGEDRHKLGRAVFHGKRGELRQRYREGQEDQLGALGLVVNIIVLWNTLYIDAALQQLRTEGFPVKAEDLARLQRSSIIDRSDDHSYKDIPPEGD
jgi:TnpA family transposase